MTSMNEYVSNVYSRVWDELVQANKISMDCVVFGEGPASIASISHMIAGSGNRSAINPMVPVILNSIHLTCYDYDYHPQQKQQR